MTGRIPEDARRSNGRVLWDKVPGFLGWFRQTAPTMTNLEMTRAIADGYGVTLNFPAVSQMRLRYQGKMTPETRRRAIVRRETATAPPTQDELEHSALRERVRELTKERTVWEIIGGKIIRAVHALPPPPAAKTVHVPSTRPRNEEEAVLLISDVQAGLTVDLRESGGLGHFSPEVLLDEVGVLRDATTSILTRYHPNIRRLHVFFLGDVVEGETIFPGQLREIEFGAIQQVLLCWEAFGLKLLAHFAGVFESVSCRGVVGNHGRIGRKGEHSPMSNFDFLLYKMWEERTKPLKNVAWKVSESWWDIAEVLGWRWLLVHGDDAGHGWAGIPFYAFLRSKTRYRELLRLIEQGNAFDYMAAGHISQVAYFSNIFINGSWPGGTEFSLKRLQLGDVPAQVLIGVHREHGATWMRPIHLKPLRPKPAA